MKLSTAMAKALRSADPSGVVRCSAGTGKALESRGLVYRRACGVAGAWFHYVLTDDGRSAARRAAIASSPPLERLGRGRFEELVRITRYHGESCPCDACRELRSL